MLILQVGKFKKMANQFKGNRKSFSKALKSRIKIIGSGRTDAGVNAWGQSANFYVKKKLKIILNF